MLKLDVSVSWSWQVPWDWALVSSSQFSRFPRWTLCSPPWMSRAICFSLRFIDLMDLIWQLMTACYYLPISSNSIIQRSCPNAPAWIPWRLAASFSSQHRRFHSWNFWLLGFRWFCPTGTTCIRWSPRCIGPVWRIAVFGACPGRDASFNWCRKIGRPSNLAHLTKAWRWLQLGALVLKIFSRVASMNFFKRLTVNMISGWFIIFYNHYHSTSAAGFSSLPRKQQTMPMVEACWTMWHTGGSTLNMQSSAWWKHLTPFRISTPCPDSSDGGVRTCRLKSGPVRLKILVKAPDFSNFSISSYMGVVRADFWPVSCASECNCTPYSWLIILTIPAYSRA